MQHLTLMRAIRRGFLARGLMLLLGLLAAGVAVAGGPGNAELTALLNKQQITDVLTRYTIVVDTKDYPGFDAVLAEDATAYYGFGETIKGRAAIVDFIRGAMVKTSTSQHLLGNVRITLDGNKASSQTYVQAILVGGEANKGQSVMLWGEYRDRLERRPEGWRIVHRELVPFHSAGELR